MRSSGYYSKKTIGAKIAIDATKILMKKGFEVFLSCLQNEYHVFEAFFMFTIWKSTFWKRCSCL